MISVTTARSRAQYREIPADHNHLDDETVASTEAFVPNSRCIASMVRKHFTQYLYQPTPPLLLSYDIYLVGNSKKMSA